MVEKLEQGKSAAHLVAEKEKRIMDAIRMKKTDRVPIIVGIGYFPSKYAGVPFSAAYYDFDAWMAAYRKTLRDFHADMVTAQTFTPGKALEYLSPKQIKWPGFNLEPHLGHQAVEVESMQANEYDAFINDTSDYMFRTHISRVSENLAGFATLPKLSGLSGQGGAQQLAIAITSKEMTQAIDTLRKTGREIRKWQKRMAKFNQMMLDVGFPEYFQGAALPAFDIVSHSLRGMSGTMIDMYRQPDKLLKACDKVLEMTLDRPMPKPNPFGNTRIFMTNTRGSDDFMSTKQFDTFYWPTFKKLVTKLIERGATPCIFFEGNFTSRLERLLEFPKGSLLARLDTTDIYKAKEILKGHTCIQGNVPATLLQAGTVQDVKEYCKKIIDIVGKDGGFILSPRSSSDEVKPENLKAMIDFTIEYGKYS